MNLTLWWLFCKALLMGVRSLFLGFIQYGTCRSVFTRLLEMICPAVSLWSAKPNHFVWSLTMPFFPYNSRCWHIGLSKLVCFNGSSTTKCGLPPRRPSISDIWGREEKGLTGGVRDNQSREKKVHVGPWITRRRDTCEIRGRYKSEPWSTSIQTLLMWIIEVLRIVRELGTMHAVAPRETQSKMPGTDFF